VLAYVNAEEIAVASSSLNDACAALLMVGQRHFQTHDPNFILRVHEVKTSKEEGDIKRRIDERQISIF
jgi:hypothetical protein